MGYLLLSGLLIGFESTSKPYHAQRRSRPSSRCDVEATLSDGLTRPLHVACRRGLEKAATLLLDNNADHTARGPGGQTALHMAAKEGKLLVVEVRVLTLFIMVHLVAGAVDLCWLEEMTYITIPLGTTRRCISTAYTDYFCSVWRGVRPGD